MHKQWHLFLFIACLLAYSVYSYSQVDPNLVLSSHPLFWSFQQFMWQLGFEHRYASLMIYLLIIIGLYLGYAGIISDSRRHQWTFKKILLFMCLSIVALLPAYPALSHDVFNYAMNAKIVWNYQADPHSLSALEFADDPWLRFMHNVHTPAPYARGWTWLSVPLGFLGQENIKLNLFIYRILMIVSLLGIIYFLSLLVPPHKRSQLLLFGINPLVLIETVGNIHNDAVMMVFAVAALVVGMRAYKRHSFILYLIAGSLLAISVSIKYGSIMMLFGLGVHYLLGRWNFQVKRGNVLAIAHFLPLLSDRSKWFLPWYLLWSLTFIPLMTSVWLKRLLIWFSVGALLSYAPYLFYGDYSSDQLMWKLILIWLLPLLGWSLQTWIYQTRKGVYA
jgi:hypothetical protein